MFAGVPLRSCIMADHGHGMRVSAALVHANALLLAEGARRLKFSKAAT